MRKGYVMRVAPFFLLSLLAQPALAQESKPEAKQALEKEIVVTGVADGARVVEVDFDKVWKNCAECKRALAKLEKLAKNYHAEVGTALTFANLRSPPSGGAKPISGLIGFSRSSAQSVEDWQDQVRRDVGDVNSGVQGERIAEKKRAHYAEYERRWVIPEFRNQLSYMRSFLDQLAPHVNDATEAERIFHRASAGLTDTKRTKLSARNLHRIDVTDAVIARLDAKDFTIVLPEPQPYLARSKRPKKGD